MQCDGCGRGIKSGYAQNTERTIIYCLSCHHVASQDRFKAMQYSLAMMNDLAGQIDDVFGLPRTQRYTIPQDNYIIEPTTNNSFNISNSAIGVINTGVVESLNSSLNDVSINDIELAKQLKELADKIGVSSKLEKEKKEQALEAITFLAEQSQRPPETRNKSLIKTTANTIKTTIGLAADLATLTPLVMSIIGKVNG